jgi:hypothetical protein
MFSSPPFKILSKMLPNTLFSRTSSQNEEQKNRDLTPSNKEEEDNNEGKYGNWKTTIATKESEEKANAGKEIVSVTLIGGCLERGFGEGYGIQITYKNHRERRSYVEAKDIDDLYSSFLSPKDRRGVDKNREENLNSKKRRLEWDNLLSQKSRKEIEKEVKEEAQWMYKKSRLGWNNLISHKDREEEQRMHSKREGQGVQNLPLSEKNRDCVSEASQRHRSRSR